MIEPDPHELRVVAGADPDREPPFVDWPFSEITDAGTQDADPVFVGVEAGECLPEGLADTVAAVGPGHDPVIDCLGARIKADGVVACGEYDALDASPARRLEDVVETNDVPFEDHRPFVLARDTAQVNDAIDPSDHFLHRNHVRELGAID